MAQKLILPVNRMLVSASYLWGTAYQNAYGGKHYGMDVYGQSQIWCQGNGTVVAAGWDNVLGYVVAILYRDCLNWVTGKTHDVVVRYYHMASISVTKGQQVNKDTRLGIIGNTGKYTDGIHLHIEIDYDTQYPLYTPTLTGNSNLCKAGYRDTLRDTTVDPRRFLHVKATAPDYQSVQAANGEAWVDPRDAQLPAA